MKMQFIFAICVCLIGGSRLVRAVNDENEFVVNAGKFVRIIF